MRWYMNIKLIYWRRLVSKPFTIASALAWAQTELSKSSDSATLDAVILLAHSLQVARSYLLAWPERTISVAQQQLFTDLVKRRAMGEPLAYITGNKEFWSLNLQVTPDTLIPRPDSELLVEIILQNLPAEQALKIADLGTGSGALALALASARPHWHIHATDRVEATLAVAQANARRLQIENLSFHLGFWYDALPAEKFVALVSNPPYIANEDAELDAAVAAYEPHAALYAGADGLTDLRYLIANARPHLLESGMLLVEHAARQAGSVAALFQADGYQKITTYKDLAGWERATAGWL
jgi:release factor glutamine methyltransferase